MIKTARLTPDQIEALIQFSQDPGARGLHYEDDRDTESRVELEAYVVSRDLDLQRERAVA